MENKKAFIDTITVMMNKLNDLKNKVDKITEDNFKENKSEYLMKLQYDIECVKIYISYALRDEIEKKMPTNYM